jgi:hypothetical protein
VAVVVLIWIASALVGIVFFAWLFKKAYGDHQASVAIGATPGRLSVSWRGMESAALCLVIDIIVVAIGVGSAIAEYTTPDTPTSPTNAAIIGLLAIPWLLTVNGAREFVHQRHLLTLVIPPLEAPPLVVACPG